MQDAPTTQATGLYRHKVGDAVVTAIYDGIFQANFGLVKGMDEAAAARFQTENFRPGQPPFTLNCFLVHRAGKLTLIDTGGGASEMFDAGRLPQALQLAGVAPEAVDTVLMTHLHADHTGGLLSEAGEAAFANAELVVHEKEIDFWLKTANPPAEMKPFFDAARAATTPYLDRLRTFTSGEVVPGIEAEPLPGHTPGHTGFTIGSGDAQLLMWADIVHLPLMQARHPEVYVAFDVDPEQAKAHRARLLDKVATDRLLVAGSHMDFPALAHVERHAAGGYAFVPEVWRPRL